MKTLLALIVVGSGLSVAVARLVPGQAPAVATAIGGRDARDVERSVATGESKWAAHLKQALGGAGDPGRGGQLFRRAGSPCLMCHGLPGEGGDVGPDLKGVGSRRGRAGLITAVLDPSAELAPGYGTVAVVTRDGREIEGDFESETADAVHLKDDRGNPVRVPKTAVKDLRRRSPMPDGLAERFTPQEFADLISFLESLR